MNRTPTTTLGLKQPSRLLVAAPLPDPFILVTAEGYWLTGSHPHDPVKGGRVFDLYFSRDLIAWEKRPSLMRVPEYGGGAENFYWAPEIVHWRGEYHLYYTGDVRGDPYQRFVRVAKAARPEGPYEDAGVRLTAQPSIDGHPFVVSEEEAWLFYTGNEGNDHMGQLMVDRLRSPGELAGSPRRVFPDETVKWEEGGFVLKTGAGFALLSSQGDWGEGNYHVLAATAPAITGPYRRCVAADGSLFRLVRSGGPLIGPGHCSAFTDLVGRRFLVFHSWDEAHTGRYPWLAEITAG